MDPVIVGNSKTGDGARMGADLEGEAKLAALDASIARELADVDGPKVIVV